jgi:hypothetical protein
MREARDRVIARVEPADFRAAARQVRLVIPVEMVGVRSLGWNSQATFEPGSRRGKRMALSASK